MVINLDSDEYSNLQKPLEQSAIFTCDHEDECGSSCPCRRNKTTCREACKCPSDCPHRFPHCDCEKSCNKGCVCIDRGRECVSGKCRRGRCINDGQGRCHSFFPLKPYISLWLAKSRIRGAGIGLFTHGVIKAHQCLGRYNGDILPDTETDSDKRPGMTAFQIAKGMSIQGIDPGNWLYWVNHPPPGKKANAEFKMVEGASERFIVLMPTRRIQQNEEILAEYAADFPGFEDVSGNKSEESCTEQSEADDYSIGEYVLIFGRCEEANHEQVWVGKIAKKYKDDNFGIHWLYHPSHLNQVDGLELPQSLKQKTRQFDPWELIISEHGSIVDKKVIMGRVGMLERAGTVKQKKHGTWWWDWVIRYRRQVDLDTNTVKNTPYMTTSKNYFRKRTDLPNWDITLRAREMKLQAIKPIKVEKETILKEEQRGAKKRERDSMKAGTPVKSKRTIQVGTENEDHDTPGAKRQRKREKDMKRHALPPLDKYLRSRTRHTDECVLPNVFDVDDEDLLSPARNEAEGRTSPNPSTTPDHDHDDQSHNETSDAVVEQDLSPKRANYSLRSIERSQVEEYDEVSDVDEELQYLFVDHDKEETESCVPNTQENERLPATRDSLLSSTAPGSPLVTR
ncbi:hypothetical protein P171DRAFT_226100 [Karstenula rhodostoma CBS 690.94]|uniref:SET domain-containing protein n=1 Tax=Karstenula rhodostoma CBS 690.94 TaxID=1392251 RepID=A0A9P4UFG6_9PLEO|nr:hypothetical protein P171DRAFT_226100 [Karstenula rhodostoma CBS 690.94]